MSSDSSSAALAADSTGRGLDKSQYVGVIGLGNVGFFYTRNLLKASMNVVVRDTNNDKMAVLESEGAEVSPSTRDLASKCGTIVLSLPNPVAVKNVVCAEGGLLEFAKPGTLIIDTSTIDPDTAASLHADFANRKIKYLECPMSGGEAGGAGQRGAENALCTFMVGGDEADFNQAKPILMLIGMHALYLGKAGTGSTVKLISNLIAGLNMAVMAEGFVLGAAAGISHQKLLEVFKHTDAKSYAMFEEFAPHMCANDYEGGFAVDLMHKDHRLAAELGHKHGVPLFLNQMATEIYQMARTKGLGRKSHVVIVEMLAEITGIKLFNKKSG